MKKKNQDEVQKVSDVTLRLISARQKLEAGWCQEKFRSGNSYCILGALGYRNEIEFEDRHAVVLIESSFSGEDWNGIDEWNDKPGRTHKEVLSVMDKAIASSLDRG